MDFAAFYSSHALWLTPLLIFLARLTDVSMGTIRIVLISRGFRRWATVIGFFESLLWLLAITQVMQQLDRPIHLFAYAGGFAGGTWLGVTLESKIALGLVAVRVITQHDATDLIEALSDARFGVTSVAARGVQGRVRLVFSIVPRKESQRVLDIVRSVHPDAFVSVTDVRSAQEGMIGLRPPRGPLAALLGKRK